MTTSATGKSFPLNDTRTTVPSLLIRPFSPTGNAQRLRVASLPKSMAYGFTGPDSGRRPEPRCVGGSHLITPGRPMFTTVSLSNANHLAPTVVPPIRDSVEVTLARTPDDLAAAFRLLHDSYVRAGLDTPNERRLRITPYHLLPSTEVFVAKLQGEVIATITMVADTQQAGLPLDAMYRDDVNQLRDSGRRLAEIGCMADRRESPAQFLKLFGEFSKLSAQVATARGIDALVGATHPRHARFYIRSLGYESFAGIKECTYAQGNLAVGLVQDFQRIEGTKVHDRLFGSPYPPEELHRTVWGDDTRALLSAWAPTQVSTSASR